MDQTKKQILENRLAMREIRRRMHKVIQRMEALKGGHNVVQNRQVLNG